MTTHFVSGTLSQYFILQLKMSLAEQPPVETVVSNTEETTPSRKPTALVWGSPEMLAVQERLQLDRALDIGGAAGQMSLEIIPVSEALDA